MWSQLAPIQLHDLTKLLCKKPEVAQNMEAEQEGTPLTTQTNLINNNDNEADQDISPSNRKTWIYVVFLTLIVIGIVIGIVAITTYSDTDDHDDDDPCGDPPGSLDYYFIGDSNETCGYPLDVRYSIYSDECAHACYNHTHRGLILC